MPIVVAGGVELYCHDAGKGPAILWLPGMAADHTAFVGQYARFKRSRRCIGIDPRGAGRSGMPQGPYSLPQMAADAIAVLDHLGIEQVDVVGHSMGGRIALDLALDWPGRVRRLALLGTSARLNAWYLAVLRSWLAMRRCLPREEWLRALAVWMCSPATFERPGWIEGFVRSSLNMPEQPLAAMEAQAAAVEKHNRWAELQRIAAPTLVLVGEHDFVLAPSRELAAAVPGAQLQVVAAAGHLLQVEQLAAVNTALDAFLAE